MKIVCKCGAESELLLDGLVEWDDDGKGKWRRFYTKGPIVVRPDVFIRVKGFFKSVKTITVLIRCRECGERICTY